MDIAGFRGPLLVFALNIVDEGIWGLLFRSEWEEGRLCRPLGLQSESWNDQSLAEGPSGRLPYTHFWYRHEPSAMWAFRKERQLYHQYNPPTTRTIRWCHPARTGTAQSLRVRGRRGVMTENAPWSQSCCSSSCG